MLRFVSPFAPDGDEQWFDLHVGGEIASIDPGLVVIAGYTGRSQEAVNHHIKELAQQGIPPPASIPTTYIAPPALLMVNPAVVKVAGSETSGEAEVVFILQGDNTFVTVGSDHTDRDLERTDIPGSKLVCPKVIADTAWRLEAVRENWDNLRLTSHVHAAEAADWELAQDATLAELLPPENLLATIPTSRSVHGHSIVLFSGTVPAKRDLRFVQAFRVSLENPLTGEMISTQHDIVHGYHEKSAPGTTRIDAAANKLDVRVNPSRRPAMGQLLEHIDASLE